MSHDRPLEFVKLVLIFHSVKDYSWFNIFLYWYSKVFAYIRLLFLSNSHIRNMRFAAYSPHATNIRRMRGGRINVCGSWHWLPRVHTVCQVPNLKKHVSVVFVFDL